MRVRPSVRPRLAPRQLFVAAAALVLIAAAPAAATPSFARRYATSCVTCHTGFPNLNAYGRAFKMQGYRMPGGDEDYIEEDVLELGAEAYKRVFPAAYWPNSIPGTAPIAVVGQLRVKRNSGGDENGVREDFLFPTGVGLIIAGTLDDTFSGWFRLQLDGETGEAEVERAFVVVADLDLTLDMFFEGGLWDGLPEDWLNIKVGRFQAGMLAFDNHVMRLSLTPFPLQTQRVGLASTPFDRLASIEAFGVFADRLSYAVGVSTGNTGQESNNTKDIYGRVAYKIGGLSLSGVDSSEDEDDDDDDDDDEEEEGDGPASEGWVETSLELGAFGYRGTKLLEDDVTGDQFSDRFWRAGVDARLALGSAELLVAAMWGNDRDAFNDAVNPGDRNKGSFVGFAEGRWVTPWPWVIGACRYEYSDLEGPGGTRHTLIPNATFLPRANVKLVVEAAFQLTQESRDATGDVLQLGLEIAF